VLGDRPTPVLGNSGSGLCEQSGLHLFGLALQFGEHILSRGLVPETGPVLDDKPLPSR
jgi:hypothetical protein